MTQAGVLKPRSKPDEPRHPRVSPLEFHESGQVARIALEHPQTLPTPLGLMPAELITFHADGAVKRVFPANGKLSTLWTEEDERQLVPVLVVPTPVGEVNARCISVCFHASGALRSVTLWPNERVEIATPVGTLSVRQGMSFREDGSLESIEPARAVVVETPLGEMRAFDPQPIGLNADHNSLEFGPQGQVTGLICDRDAVVVALPDGTQRRFEPTALPGDCADACIMGEALRVRFEGDSVALRLGRTRERHPLQAVTLESCDDGRRHLPCIQ